MAICEICWNVAQRTHMDEDPTRTVTEIYNELIDGYLERGGHLQADKQAPMYRRHASAHIVTPKKD